MCGLALLDGVLNIVETGRRKVARHMPGCAEQMPEEPAYAVSFHHDLPVT